jgi:hypothetical protein
MLLSNGYGTLRVFWFHIWCSSDPLSVS